MTDIKYIGAMHGEIGGKKHEIRIAYLDNGNVCLSYCSNPEALTSFGIVTPEFVNITLNAKVIIDLLDELHFKYHMENETGKCETCNETKLKKYLMIDEPICFDCIQKREDK